ncbi:DNA replication protein DnaC [Caballeronia glathei]|uniref:DNA replication protein DnaC n=1 Tax=Caballeronia glathei TaxID=60547 RepID=A0A069PW31_9BURK|nr:ATP-binding protein [Caballeronia glathei]KDR41561.1 DNA replication protein DnaC [Caballeronia glathei]CDY79444.1 DNA replication protein DnaC [Caballeronia glathei]
MMEVSEAKVSRTSECDRHGSYEESGVTLPFGSRRTIWSGCVACNAERRETEEKRRIAEEEAQRQRRLEQRLSTSGIPLRFRDRTFDNFVADTDAKKTALQIAAEFVDQFADHAERGTTVIFSGKPGTGKSHLALAAAMAVMKSSTALYVNALDLIRMVRDTWRRDSEMTESAVLNELSAVSLLVIDEIGVQYGTEGEQVILFDVLNRRYRDLMPTILLTNLGKTGMKEFLGERSFDRLREGGIWVAFDWESHRGARKAA